MGIILDFLNNKMQYINDQENTPFIQPGVNPN